MFSLNRPAQALKANLVAVTLYNKQQESELMISPVEVVGTILEYQESCDNWHRGQEELSKGSKPRHFLGNRGEQIKPTCSSISFDC